jgi:hypothetical protein
MRPGVLRPSENRNASDLRQPFLEQLNAFAHKLNGQIAHAGKIAGWSRPTLDEFTIDRITAEAEDHRLCRLQIPHRNCHKFLRDYDVRIGGKDLACHTLHVFPPRCPERDNFQIAPFDPSQLAQACSQGF